VKIENVNIANNFYESSNKNGQQALRVVEENEVADFNQPVKKNFPGEKQLIEAIEKSNKDLILNNTSLKFSIHEATKEIIVKVIDNETKEIVKEIPPEKILDMIASMLEKTGIFVDNKA
jgi:flagellar protein FlaG